MYPLLAAAALPEPIELGGRGIDVSDVSSAAFAQSIVDVVGWKLLPLRHVAEGPRIDSVAEVSTFPQLLERWRAEEGLQTSVCGPVGWIGWEAVAECLARCSWP
jgi:hypothetical protein